jgi:hypothetical protein
MVDFPPGSTRKWRSQDIILLVYKPSNFSLVLVTLIFLLSPGQTAHQLLSVHSQKRASRNRSATDLLNPVVNKPISGRVRSPCTCLLILTGPQRPVNRSVRSCCDRAAAMLFSTDLSHVVDTELQQCCFQQLCDRPVANRGKHLMKLVYPLFWTLKNGQTGTGCHISVVVFREIARLSCEHL